MIRKAGLPTGGCSTDRRSAGDGLRHCWRPNRRSPTGRRRLAYEIRKKSEGIYAVINLTANPSDVKELDRQFTISEQIMRTKVIRPDLH